jgi:hypothetical protein
MLYNILKRTRVKSFSRRRKYMSKRLIDDVNRSLANIDALLLDSAIVDPDSNEVVGGRKTGLARPIAEVTGLSTVVIAGREGETAEAAAIRAGIAARDGFMPLFVDRVMEDMGLKGDINAGWSDGSQPH